MPTPTLPVVLSLGDDGEWRMEYARCMGVKVNCGWFAQPLADGCIGCREME